jgi:predicted kinase
MIIYIMVGAPCSGKTTLAKKMLEYDNNIIRVNRDELRVMLKGRYVVGDYYIESVINKLTEDVVGLACIARKDILIDATHVKVRYINDIKKMIPEFCNYTIKYVVCDEPLWRLKLRNVLRYLRTGMWIPNKVLTNMYHNSRLIQSKINSNEI